MHGERDGLIRCDGVSGFPFSVVNARSDGDTALVLMVIMQGLAFWATAGDQFGRTVRLSRCSVAPGYPASSCARGRTS